MLRSIRFPEESGQFSESLPHPQRVKQIEISGLNSKVSICRGGGGESNLAKPEMRGSSF